MDLSSSYKIILNGVSCLSPSFCKIDKGIKLILAPKSHNTLSKFMLPITQEMVKLLGSLSFKIAYLTDL